MDPINVKANQSSWQGPKTARELFLAPLLEEYHRLIRENLPPLSDIAYAAWLMVDTFSGCWRDRDYRLEELQRDILLALYGHQLVPIEDDSHRGLFALRTFPPVVREAFRLSGKLFQSQYFLFSMTRWIAVLKDIAEDHLYVACRTCQEPIFMRENIDEALKQATYTIRPATFYWDGPGEPEIQYNPIRLLGNHWRIRHDDFITSAIHVEFRSIGGGPTSAPIDRCVNCQANLSKHTTEPISLPF